MSLRLLQGLTLLSAVLVACSGSVAPLRQSSGSADATVGAGTADAAGEGEDSPEADESADTSPSSIDWREGGPPVDPTSATSYLITPAHTNAVVGSSLRPPLARLWTANLAGAASYPLIAEGRVYAVAAATGGGTTATALALDARTGATVWSTALPSALSAGLAYDGGRVFTEDATGLVSAFDASTGVLAWSRSMVGPYTWAFSGIPTAYRGILYTSAGGDGGTLFAFDEITGELIFQNLDLLGGYDSPPALDDSGLVVAYACEQTYKRDRISGALLWHYTTACSGGGADTPVIESGRVYVTDPMSNVAVDESSGTATGTFVSGVPPSFDGAFGFFASGTQLTAVDARSGLTAWTFAESNGTSFEFPPLLAGGYAYTVDSSGELMAFDENTGKPAWTDGATITAPLAASGGLLIVPEGRQLVAYGSAGDGAAADGWPAGGEGGCAFNMADVQEPVVGTSPSDVAIGDLNGDGKPDVAVAISDSTAPGMVSVMLGTGSGTFFPAVAYAVGAASDAVAIADLNGDGNLDLAVLNAGDPIPVDGVPSSVSVLLGRGNGTFQPQVTFATNTGSSALAVADLNGDGVPDFATANNALGDLSVLLGNGDGTFQPAVTTFDSTRSIAVSIAAGDLNGDGKPDLVTADENYDVDVRLNNSDGTFQPAVPYATLALPCCVTEPLSVALGDFDRDGNLDVVVDNYGAKSVSVLLGNGDGTLKTQVPYTTNDLPQTVRVGDVNGDGFLDLVVVDGASRDLSVLLGKGDGTFQPQLFFAVAGNTYSMAVGDLNGDGKADIVATAAPGSVGVLLSTCSH